MFQFLTEDLGVTEDDRSKRVLLSELRGIAIEQSNPAIHRLIAELRETFEVETNWTFEGCHIHILNPFGGRRSTVELLGKYIGRISATACYGETAITKLSYWFWQTPALKRGHGDRQTKWLDVLRLRVAKECPVPTAEDVAEARAQLEARLIQRTEWHRARKIAELGTARNLSLVIDALLESNSDVSTEVREVISAYLKIVEG